MVRIVEGLGLLVGVAVFVLIGVDVTLVVVRVVIVAIVVIFFNSAFLFEWFGFWMGWIFEMGCADCVDVMMSRIRLDNQIDFMWYD